MFDCFYHSNDDYINQLVSKLTRSEVFVMTTVTTIVFVALCVAFVACKDTSGDWKNYKAKYKKSYNDKSSKTETAAKTTYQKNYDAIKKHNSNPDVTYQRGVNAFTDLSPKEVVKTRTGYKKGKEHLEETAGSKKVKAALKAELRTRHKRGASHALPDELDYER
jgi:uncharacterized protein YxeA